MDARQQCFAVRIQLHDGAPRWQVYDRWCNEVFSNTYYILSDARRLIYISDGSGVFIHIY
jgi:hypothetical protein